jgi:hypothetical protein
MDPKRVSGEGYDRMGEDFAAWNDALPSEGRRCFLGETLTRLPSGSAVLELGSGPGHPCTHTIQPELGSRR